ncbi:MAG: nickel pincer cofactor biosynthesis protein LarC [Promethearchaeota archaeon]
MKVLYIDTTNSGFSGDMFLAALLNLINNKDEIISELCELKNYLSGVKKLNISLNELKRSGILINKLEIKIEESKTHRKAESLKIALNKFLNEKNFSDLAKRYANSVLDSLIQAESEIHGELTNQIHLHELSSVDTLIDVLGVSRVLDLLGTFNKEFTVFCSKLPLGSGIIKTAHGFLPIPAPATLKILENSNLEIFGSPIISELVTPTGAALLTSLNPKTSSYEMRLEKVVYSTGQKKFDNFSNILRLFYGTNEQTISQDENHVLQNYIEPVCILETDVDDVSGEILGNFIKSLESENILDVQVIPSITKKNRPSHIIQVLCLPKYKFQIIEMIIEELGTLGVRVNTIERVCIDRKIEKRTIEVNNKKYEIRVKISFINLPKEQKIINIKPEYEDLKKISKLSGLPVKKVLTIAHSDIKDIF